MNIYETVCLLKNRYGWYLHEQAEKKIWFKGHLISHSVDTLFNFNFEQDAALLHGHFSLIYKDSEKTILITDKIRSIPLSFSVVNYTFYIAEEGHELLAKNNEIFQNDLGVACFEMCGYTIGGHSLYRNISVLRAGEILTIKNQTHSVSKYYSYTPWNSSNKTYVEFQDLLEQVTLKIFKNLILSIEGRQIVVPISGGVDSRLVLSSLKKLGYTNVVCFSYGKKNNFEAKIGRAVAEKIGFPWHFVSLSRSSIKKHIQSKVYQRYLKFSDNFSSLPFFQDNFAIHHLKKKKIIESDAVFVNGNTGDFISGGHQWSVGSNIDGDINLKTTLIKSFIAKHCSLWPELLIPKRFQLIENLLESELDEINQPVTTLVASGLFERLEFENRQSKFVISGQRNYEFYGHEWRLPLWDDLYLEFWQKVPIEFKKEQKLYKETWLSLNWGQVWHDITLNQINITPRWVIPIRLIFKLLLAVFGRKAWQKFDRRFFSYFTEPLGLFGQWSYFDIAFNRRDARNIVAWRASKYLHDNCIKTNNLNLDSKIK